MPESLVGAQHGAIKTGALHLHQLVHQHVAGGADFTRKTQASAQQECLAESATVGELGKVQINARDTCKRHGARIDVVGHG